MIVTVLTDKGGNGKTPISINIAMDNNFLIATNQKFNIYENIINDDELLVLDMDDEFPSELKSSEYDVVIDLAGQISEGSKSVLSAINLADIIVVPIMNDRASINGGINSIQQVKQFNQNIVVIATNLKLGYKEINTNNWKNCLDFKIIAEEVSKYHKGIKILPLKHTTGFTKVNNEIKSLKQLSKNNPLLKTAYKKVVEQLNDIYKNIGVCNE